MEKSTKQLVSLVKKIEEHMTKLETKNVESDTQKVIINNLLKMLRNALNGDSKLCGI